MASNSQGNQGGKSNRGFASMDPQRQREIASEGGRAAHEKGTAHEFTSEEAREAGRKGGQARSANRRNAMASQGGNTHGGSSGMDNS
jgi:general stress protein YciG